MSWTNLAMLAVGVGVGAMGGWWAGQRQPQAQGIKQASDRDIASGGTVRQTTVLQTTVLQTGDDQTLDQQSPNQQTSDRAATRQLQAQLQQTQVAYRMAQESERFKAGFLARTSHELRSPLNSVMSLQQLILSDLCEDAAEEREFVAQAYTASQKMLGLLDKLIGVSKAAYGTEQIQIQPVCLEDVLMEVESLTLMQARNRTQQLKIEYPDADVWVMADPRWLRQVLVSLVDQPISLMQEGVIQVRCQVQPEAEQVLIQVEDERPASYWSEPIDLLQIFKDRGILDSLAEKPDIAHLTDLGPIPSPGLSLLVNQTILDLMGGRLEILAVPTDEQKTTLVQVTLPLAARLE